MGWLRIPVLDLRNFKVLIDRYLMMYLGFLEALRPINELVIEQEEYKILILFAAYFREHTFTYKEPVWLHKLFGAVKSALELQQFFTSLKLANIFIDFEGNLHDIIMRFMQGFDFFMIWHCILDYLSQKQLVAGYALNWHDHKAGQHHSAFLQSFLVEVLELGVFVICQQFSEKCASSFVFGSILLV